MADKVGAPVSIVCSVCRNILNDPKVFPSCGHRLCAPCIQLEDDGHVVCKMEHEEGEDTKCLLQELLCDKAAKREIKNFLHPQSNGRTITETMPSNDRMEKSVQPSEDTVFVDVNQSCKEKIIQAQTPLHRRNITDRGVAVIEAEMTRLRRDIDTHETEHRNITLDQSLMDARVRALEKNEDENDRSWEAIREQVGELKITLESLEGRVKLQTLDQPENQCLNDINAKLSLHDIQLAKLDLRFQMLETASYDGTLLWKLRDYPRKKQEAIAGRKLSLDSQPFYTHQFGYKMCARVYLNGDGMGEGTHMSLFFVMMRGEYDNLLQWPFQQKVTMTLLDQANGQQNVSATFKPNQNSCFQKPESDLVQASGCSKFVLHAILESHTYLNHDTVFIKLEVDTTNSESR